MFAMANYQQPNPYNNLQYWYKMQQQQQAQQEQQQQQQQQQLEQQGYVKKKGCNCGGKKKW
ncbi:cytochrome C oxidase subunit III [Bacillus sp. S13(2024)]|uniref:cytochrome C oxidase subunit III n=1 Tax=unclassified Bacillus (in: firmicutes) TaxID=185979 RepID=UPI003D225F29